MAFETQGIGRIGAIRFLRFGNEVLALPQRATDRNVGRETNVAGRWLLAICGVSALISSLLIVGAPVTREWSASLSFGGILVICAGVGLLCVSRLDDGWPFVGVFAASIVSVLGGALLFVQAVRDAPDVSTLTAGYLAVTAIVRAWIGIRNIDMGGWVFAGLGVVAISFAAMIWAGLPDHGLWAPQLLLGIDLALCGAGLMLLALRNEPTMTTMP